MSNTQGKESKKQISQEVVARLEAVTDEMAKAEEQKKAKINELYERGKAKGMLTYKEILNQLMSLDIEPDQFDKVLETLESLGVEVVNEMDDNDHSEPINEPIEEDLDLSVPEGVSVDDPVRMYLKEIG